MPGVPCTPGEGPQNPDARSGVRREDERPKAALHALVGGEHRPRRQPVGACLSQLAPVIGEIVQKLACPPSAVLAAERAMPFHAGSGIGLDVYTDGAQEVAPLPVDRGRTIASRPPAAASTAKVPISETGIATIGMIAARHFCRKTRMTSTTSCNLSPVCCLWGSPLPRFFFSPPFSPRWGRGKERQKDQQL